MKNDTFKFNCTPNISCFNACCRDLNQFLFPYDIIRLKRHFGITSNAFLNTYTATHTGPETGLPVVTLRPKNSSDLTCPFVSQKGCMVYQNRPASCRMYPLARAISRHRETGRLQEHFARIEESHCRGHESSHAWIPEEWMSAQGLNEYNRVNDQMMVLISLKHQIHPEPLDLIMTRMFYTACYDIDTFRDHIRNDDWGHILTFGHTQRKRLMKDDLALLEFGLKWIQTKLTGR